MREYSIGEIFEEDGAKIVCVPARVPNTCGLSECVFLDKKLSWCANMACMAGERKDNTCVYFLALNNMGKQHEKKAKEDEK